MRRALVICGICAALGSLVWLRAAKPKDIRKSVPAALFAEWRAEDGPHAGNLLLITRERVEISGPSKGLEGGQLLGIYAVKTDGGYARYRLEYGDPTAPGTLTVMLDSKNRLRLANRPQSTWAREKPRR